MTSRLLPGGGSVHGDFNSAMGVSMRVSTPGTLNPDDIGLTASELGEMGLSMDALLRPGPMGRNSGTYDNSSGASFGGIGGGFPRGGDDDDEDQDDFLGGGLGSNQSVLNQESKAGDEDVRLWLQNQRFQAAVMKAMDRTVSVLQDKLQEKVASLSASEQSREDLAIGLHQMRTELQRALLGLNRSRKDLEEAVSSRKLALTELANVQKELSTAKKDTAEAQNEIARLRKDAISVNEQSHKLKGMQSILESELKIAKQMNQNVTSELDNKSQKVKETESAMAEVREQLQAIHSQHQALKQKLADQEGETQTALRLAERFERDMKAAQEARNVLLKQWETAMSAMEQRDVAIKSLADEHAKTVNELRAERERVAATTKDADQIEARRLEAERAQEQEMLRVNALASEVAMLKKDRDKGSKEVVILISQVEALEAALEAKTRTEASLREQVELHKARTAATSAELADTRKQFFQMRAEAERRLAMQSEAESEMRETFEAELKEAKRTLAATDNEKNFTQLRLIELEEEMRKTKISHESLDTNHRRVLTDLEQVRKETKSLEDELERATYKANKQLHQTLAVQKRAEEEKHSLTTATETEIRALKAKLADKQQQLESLSAAFLATQRKILSAHNAEKNLYESASSLQSQLALAQALRDRFKSNVESLETKYEDTCRQTDEVKLTLRRTEKTVAEQREQIAALEKKLADAMFYERVKRADHEQEVSVLKAQLARQENDGKDWIGMVQRAQKDKLALEAKCDLQGMYQPKYCCHRNVPVFMYALTFFTILSCLYVIYGIRVQSRAFRKCGER